MLPRKIRVVGKDWKVIWDFKEVDTDGNFGQTSPVNLEIRLGSASTEQKKRETLLHEILHAIDFTLSSPKVSIKEPHIKLLAAGLFQVLTENPDVTAYIIGKSWA